MVLFREVVLLHQALVVHVHQGLQGLQVHLAVQPHQAVQVLLAAQVLQDLLLAHVVQLLLHRLNRTE